MAPIRCLHALVVGMVSINQSFIWFIEDKLSIIIIYGFSLLDKATKLWIQAQVATTDSTTGMCFENVQRNTIFKLSKEVNTNYLHIPAYYI